VVGRRDRAAGRRRGAPGSSSRAGITAAGRTSWRSSAIASSPPATTARRGSGLPPAPGSRPRTPAPSRPGWRRWRERGSTRAAVARRRRWSSGRRP